MVDFAGANLPNYDFALLWPHWPHYGNASPDGIKNLCLPSPLHPPSPSHLLLRLRGLCLLLRAGLTGRGDGHRGRVGVRRGARLPQRGRRGRQLPLRLLRRRRHHHPHHLHVRRLSGLQGRHGWDRLLREGGRGGDLGVRGGPGPGFRCLIRRLWSTTLFF